MKVSIFSFHIVVALSSIYPYGGNQLQANAKRGRKILEKFNVVNFRLF